MRPIPSEQLPSDESVEVVIQGPEQFRMTLPVAFLWVTSEGVCFVEAGYYQNPYRPAAQCALGSVVIEDETITVSTWTGSVYRFCPPSNWLVRTVLRQWRDWCETQGVDLDVERARLWDHLQQSMRVEPADRPYTEPTGGR